VAQDVDNPNNWTDIADEMRGAFRGRNGKSCRLRWCNQLDPKLRRDAFSGWEDAVIIKAHEVRRRAAGALPRQRCQRGARRACLSALVRLLVCMLAGWCVHLSVPAVQHACWTAACLHAWRAVRASA